MGLLTYSPAKNINKRLSQKGLLKDKITFSNHSSGCGNVYKNGKLLKLKPQAIPIDIVYEDNNMYVINKPSGMLTHPSYPYITDTLVNALLYMSKGKLSDSNGELCRGIVHRLDKDTSGLLMISKNNDAHAYLKKQIYNHNIEKKYLAIVKGVIKEDKLVIDKPIGKDEQVKYKMTIDTEKGKPSKTIVKVLKRYKDATFVEVQIITGRTHQIRVHMASIGHPVYNDPMYGKDEHIEGIVGQALMSYKLTFHKPFDGKTITVEIPMDEKLTKIISILENE